MQRLKEMESRKGRKTEAAGWKKDRTAGEKDEAEKPKPSAERAEHTKTRNVVTEA